MENIEKHIQKDKEILQDPTTNPQMRRPVSYTHLTLPTNREV